MIKVSSSHILKSLFTLRCLGIRGFWIIDNDNTNTNTTTTNNNNNNDNDNNNNNNYYNNN